jgi:bidirectional [NiFe] hydrogenase diaphorase subunit
MITIVIDGKDYVVEEGLSLLKVLRANGKAIPSLCYHPALKKPIGACKLCAVQIQVKGRPEKIALSCAAKTSEGLQVETETDAVRLARSNAIELLLALAPQSGSLLKLAAAYDIEIPFQPDGCIRCHLCERVCREIVGADALKMVKREGRKYIVPVEGACIGCGTCANICPTQAIRIEDKETVRTISIRDEIIGIHPLERCEGCGKRFATPKFLEYIHHRTLHHPDVKEHHQYCPSCAKLFFKGKQPMPAR